MNDMALKLNGINQNFKKRKRKVCHDPDQKTIKPPLKQNMVLQSKARQHILVGLNKFSSAKQIDNIVID